MNNNHSNYFYGHKISDSGIAAGYVDYATLAKAVNAVMDNSIFDDTADRGEWEPISGYDFGEDDDFSPAVSYWLTVDEFGARLLQEADEIVYYNEVLDMYVWGVTHYGLPWQHTMTNIKIA